MKDAWTSNDLNILRARDAGARWYLAVHKPASVFSANLSAVPSYPGASLNLYNTTGDISNVKPGYTLIVGSAIDGEASGGSEKGRLRVRSFMTESSIINTAEFGSGLINWKADDKITVIEQLLPWVKHPRYDTSASAWKMDYDIAYEDHLENYRPVVRMGPPMVGTLGDEGFYNASFIGASTKLWDGATLDTAIWTFPGNPVRQQGIGSPGSLMINTFQQLLTDGSHFSLEVTDSNGGSHSGSRLVWIFNAASEAQGKVEFAQITGGLEQGGYETQIRVLANANFEQFPDLAEFVIFEEASYGGTPSTIGGNYPFRSNVVMRGWIIGESIRINPFHGEVTFRGRTVDGIMEHQESYDTFLTLSSTDVTRTAFPSALSPANSINTDWNAAASLSLDRMFYHQAVHRSNLADLTDINFAGGDFGDASKLIIFQDLPRAPFWKQLQMNYYQKGFLGYLAADMQSTVFAGEDIQISGGSGDVPIALPMNKGDRRGVVQIERSVIDPVAEAHLLSISGSDPYWAISPGQVMGYFGGKKEHSKGLFWHQDDLVQRVGNYRAKLNNEYPKIIVPLAGNYRLDSVPQSRVTMSLSPADNSRGLKWDDEGFIPAKTTLTYNARAGAVLADIEMEKVVQGIGGSAVTFPSVPVSTPPPEDVPDPAPPPGDNPAEGNGFGTVYVMVQDGLFRTRDFSASPPTYTQIDGTVTGTRQDWILDPWSPSDTGYLLTSTGVWKSTDLDLASPSFTQVLADGGSLGAIKRLYTIHASINVQDWVGFVFVDGTGARSDDIKFGYSVNGGSTWSSATIHSVANNHEYNGAYTVVPSTAGPTAYCSFVYFNGSSHRYMTSKSTDGGATWNTVTSTGQGAGGFSHGVFSLHAPYDGQDGAKLYYGAMTNAGGDLCMYSADSGNNITVVDGQGETNIDPCNRTATETYTQDANIVAYRSGSIFRLSQDGASTFSTVHTFTGDVVACGGFPFNDGQFYVVTVTSGTINEVSVSVDGGESWDDKTGTLSGEAADGRSCVIVPLWVSE